MMTIQEIQALVESSDHTAMQVSRALLDNALHEATLSLTQNIDKDVASELISLPESEKIDRNGMHDLLKTITTAKTIAAMILGDEI